MDVDSENEFLVIFSVDLHLYKKSIIGLVIVAVLFVYIVNNRTF